MGSSLSMGQTILPLYGHINTSVWGKVGSSSGIYPFLKSFEEYVDKPLAELWLGVHANGTSTVLKEGREVSLSEVIKEEGGVDLPYLAKLLSVNLPLSIQLHPNKEQAEVLHKKDPTHYPDSNPKPEMAIALTEVELLCGMRPSNELENYFNSRKYLGTLDPNLLMLIREQRFEEALKVIFSLSKSKVNSFIQEVVSSGMDGVWEDVVRKYISQGGSPNPGMIVVFFLSYHKLMPGEAFYIAPGVPHAYLKGDMFECMQASDNVVRGGLTNKYIDEGTFIKLSDKRPYDGSLKGQDESEGVKVYTPPECPFLVRHLGGSKVSLKGIKLNSVLINFGSEAKIVSEGGSCLLKEKSSYFFKDSLDEALIFGEKDLNLFLVS